MKNDKRYFKVGTGVWGMKILFVNIYMISSNGHWVLVDTGLAGSSKRILKMAADLFDGKPPSAILLTHGHFDHRGSVPELLETWRVPVFAHQLELPYLTGRSAYPPPDPTVGGGLMSLLSFLYPKCPVDLGKHLCSMPEDGSVPYLHEWQAILTPGHAPGQVALFRKSDRQLIAADAFVTTRQESLIATLKGIPEVSGPPRYFTYDWNAAKASVLRLHQMEPHQAATGHGPAIGGKQLADGLGRLVTNFDQVARPHHGRYVSQAARTDKTGVTYLPPRRLTPLAVALGGLLAAAVLIWSKDIF